MPKNRVNHVLLSDDIRGKLKDTLGVEVIRAGIGDKVHLEQIFKT